MCVPEGGTLRVRCTHPARRPACSRALPCGALGPTSAAPFSTSRAEVPKGPVCSLPSWGGGVGTLPCLLPSLHAPWLGPGGRLGPGEIRARLAPSVCPPGRVASVCSGCWLLPAQARGLDALYGEPSAPQGPTLGFGTTSLLGTSREQARGPPAATGRGRDVSVASSPVCPRAEAWAGLASALSTVPVSHRKTHAAGTPHTGEGAVPLNVHRGHVRSTGQEEDAGPPAKLRMGPSCPAGWRGGQEPRVSQNSPEALDAEGLVTLSWHLSSGVGWEASRSHRPKVPSSPQTPGLLPTKFPASPVGFRGKKSLSRGDTLTRAEFTRRGGVWPGAGPALPRMVHPGPSPPVSGLGERSRSHRGRGAHPGHNPGGQ